MRSICCEKAFWWLLQWTDTIETEQNWKSATFKQTWYAFLCFYLANRLQRWILTLDMKIPNWTKKFHSRNALRNIQELPRILEEREQKKRATWREMPYKTITMNHKISRGVLKEVSKMKKVKTNLEKTKKRMKTTINEPWNHKPWQGLYESCSSINYKQEVINQLSTCVFSSRKHPFQLHKERAAEAEFTSLKVIQKCSC